MPDYQINSTAANIDKAVANANLMLLTGATDPTTSTVGTLGQIYLNTTTGAKFECTAVGATYTWVPEVINDLTTGGTKSKLSAEQGKALGQLISELDADGAVTHRRIEQPVLDVITTGIFHPGFEAGSLNASTGAEIDGAAYVRTGMILLPPYSVIRLSDFTNYYFYVFRFGTDKVFTSYVTRDGATFQNGAANLYVRIAIRKRDNTQIEPSEYATLINILSITLPRTTIQEKISNKFYVTSTNIVEVFETDANFLYFKLANTLNVYVDGVAKTITWAEFIAGLTDYTITYKGIDSVIKMSTRRMLVYDTFNDTIKMDYLQTNDTKRYVELLGVDSIGKATGGALLPYLLYGEYLKEKSESEYPGYDYAMVNTVINSVRSYQKEANTTSFAFITDIHWGDNLHTSYRLLKELMEACSIPLCINGGDNVSTQTAIAKETLISDIKTVQKLYGDKCVYIRGNHEAVYSNDGVTAFTTTIPNDELNDLYFRKQEANVNLYYDDDPSYYYVDDPRHKVRYICLNFCDYVKTGNTVSFFCIGQEQLTWLADTLENIPSDDWHIVVASHVHPTTTSTASTINTNIALGIVSAYANKTTYSATGDNVDYPVTISADFSTAKGTLVCWIAGHTHNDTAEVVSGIQMVCTTSDMPDTRYTEYNRDALTSNEQAFDIFTINKSTKAVNITRVGAGSNRSFTY